MPIALWGVVVLLVGRFIFRMRVGDFFSALSVLRWRLLVRAALIALIGLGLYTLVVQLVSGVGLRPLTGEIVGALVAVVLLVPLQSAAEELVFRGFAPQVVLGRIGFSVPKFWIVSVILSVLFASVHGGRTATAWLAYFVFGLVFAFLVRGTAGLESSIALHAVNNVLFVGTGVLTGGDLAARQTNTTVGLTTLIQMIVVVVIAAVIAVLARRDAKLAS